MTQRIYTANGTLVGEYHYDAWGNILNESTLTEIAKLNPFRYRGYYYDSESGLHYLNSRYYDPETGRFISGDVYVSTGQGISGHNMFAYALNNPIAFCDPSGNLAIEFLIALEILEKVVIPAAITYVILSTPVLQEGIVDFADAIGRAGDQFIDDIANLWKRAVSQAGSRSHTESIAIPKAEETTPPSMQAVYYGADTYGGSWKIATGPMNYETAVNWTIAVASSGVYGKQASWGLYTSQKDHAESMAITLGGYNPLHDEKQPGKYAHYHVNGHDLFGIYKHYHVWYGTKG